MLIESLTLLAVAAPGSVSSTNVPRPPAASARPVAAQPAPPTARVGAFYFDGWSGPLSNFHFDGLAHPGPNGQFPGRQPLYGWRDNSLQSMRTQLSWARQDGISFFVFDWFRKDVDPLINVAHDNYLKLREHQGVGFALMWVNNDIFGIPLDQWPAVVEKWVTQDFLNPDYVRIDGKPLLIVYETQEATRQWGGAAGVNRAIAILQEAARRHGLPGVFVVGGHQDYWDYTVGCFLNCGYDGDLLAQHYDALTKYTSNLSVQPVDGPMPYSNLVASEERNWDRYAQESPFPYIPSVAAGWDGRAADERPEGHLFWFTRSPAELGGFLNDAIAWVGRNPRMRVEPAPAPPVVLIEAWNELQEGAFVLPTKDDDYGYGQAIASALGIPWTGFHARHIVVSRVRPGPVRGELTVDDSWSPCQIARLALERRSSHRWRIVRTTTAKPDGSFAARLPRRRGAYRVAVARTVRYRQSCGPAVSRTFEH